MTDPNSLRQKRKWLRKVGVATLLILCLLILFPYIAVAVFIEYVQTSRGDIRSLSSVLKTHVLAPMPDMDSGQFFTVGALSFTSPLASTSVILSSSEFGRFVSGDRRILIVENDSGTISANQALVMKTNTMLLSFLQKGVNNDYQLRTRIFDVTPENVYGSPSATLANGILLFLKADYTVNASGTGSLLIFETNYINVTQLTTSSSGDNLNAALTIFDKNGIGKYSLSIVGLTQGEIDALVASIKIQ